VEKVSPRKKAGYDGKETTLEPDGFGQEQSKLEEQLVLWRERGTDRSFRNCLALNTHQHLRRASAKEKKWGQNKEKSRPTTRKKGGIRVETVKTGSADQKQIPNSSP